MLIKPELESEYAEYVKNNSEDGYNKGVVDFGERWAKAMELRLAAGEKLQDFAEKTSFETADGITGFMYGRVVSALAKFWVHGEELRQWHNLDTQIGNEGEKANESGGTLNPALLNIQPKT